MLSFGIDAARAFSIAFWSARFAAGSGPPSFAATISARVSFVNSCPRFASAAPFLCLIDDHLLCPDIRLLPNQFQKALVQARVVRQLRVERRNEKTALDCENPDLHESDSRCGSPANRSARSGRQPCAAQPAASPWYSPSRSVGSAPSASRTSTAASWPACAARWSGGTPCPCDRPPKLERPFGSAPSSTRRRIASTR